MTAQPTTTDTLDRLSRVIDSRLPQRGGDPCHQLCGASTGPGAGRLSEKIGEEATEVVMAAKDADHGADTAAIVAEVADLWFHCLIALAHYGLNPAQVLAELARRADTSGLEEKALRKAHQRSDDEDRAKH